MSLGAADVLIWVLRAFGALYVLGGLFLARQMWFWARIGPSMNKLARTLSDFQAELEPEKPRPAPALTEDVGRSWWLFAGAILTAVSGVAMLIGHRAAVPLLALLVVQQMLYFIRQRRAELRASSRADAEEARPTQATINGFVTALLLAVLAAWLGWQGALI